jgi:tetratricopeptide (TPR) repeat protein
MSISRIASPASRLESMTTALVIVATLALFSTAACSKAAGVKAMMTFKQANQAYQQADYKRAVQLYEETIQNDPSLAQVYFFLGNSYDNLYKPGVKGQPANDELLTKAVQNYQLAAEKLAADKPADAKLKVLALQYLVAGYGPDKLNDPAQAEPVLQRMIQLEPGDPSSYFVLAKLYEDAGAYDEAEKVLNLAKLAKPGDAAVYMQLAGYYKRQDKFPQTIGALEERASKEPNNPEAFYTVSTYYWDEAYRNARLKDTEKKEYIQKGVDAVDHALQIKPDYVEALVYKNLLLRLQANVEKDPAKQQALIKQADVLRDKATELRKQKASGVGD